MYWRLIVMIVFFACSVFVNSFCRTFLLATVPFECFLLFVSSIAVLSLISSLRLLSLLPWVRLQDIEEFNVALSLVDVVVLINRGTSLFSRSKSPSGREDYLSDISTIGDEVITRLACAGTRSMGCDWWWGDSDCDLVSQGHDRWWWGDSDCDLLSQGRESWKQLVTRQ